ncbi:hypothetical protein HQN60_12530 [Deefgea piscis]|uniref:Uncharacterized protein n=1 Tax=Deefgea piscis TaxID=2739061 RepID=A0A6M8STM0_9NEIS|nr:hypothetical protein [Deefgea piscis]QKJ67464.1 hypothetical protein HQN60_12530 [Deefgea piscis]
MSIPVLHHHNFAAPIRKLTGFKSKCVLCIIYDETGVQRRVYLFAHPHTSKGLANQLAYWMIQAYADCQPSDAAWLIQLPRATLSQLWPDHHWHELHTCWALQEIPNSSPESLSTTHSAALMRDLNAWPDLALIIGINEMLCLNSATPTTRLGVGRYAAIDGGDLLGGEYWTIPSLKRLTCTHNHLAHLAGFTNSWGIASEHHQQQVQAACAKLPQQLSSIEELLEWLQFMLTDQAALAAIKFIRPRLNLARTRWNPHHDPRI